VRENDPNAVTCPQGDVDACIEKLAGKTVMSATGAVQQQDVTEWNQKLTAAGKPAITFQGFENQAQAAAALARGVGDASEHEDHQTAYFMQQFPGRFRLLFKGYQIAPVALTVRKEPEARPLADALVVGLQRIKANGTYDRILQKWNMTGVDSFDYQK
jgi:ABC-type amino acid transport substrate-binding protein